MGGGPALGLGVGWEGNLDVRGFSPESRSMWQVGMGILPGLGLGPGIRQDSRSARGELALQDCTPHVAVWGEDEKRGTVMPGPLGLQNTQAIGCYSAKLRIAVAPISRRC